ncbi:MAG: hypothetical protein WCG95_06325 [bacterium]
MLNKIGSTPPQQQQAQLKRNSNPSFGNVLVEISKSREGKHSIARLGSIVKTHPGFENYSILNTPKVGTSTKLAELANVTIWNKKVSVGSKFTPLEIDNSLDARVRSLLEKNGFKTWG